jgi:hypothetical protein
MQEQVTELRNSNFSDEIEVRGIGGQGAQHDYNYENSE